VIAFKAGDSHAHNHHRPRRRLIGSVAFAQQPDPGAVITFASSADVAALAAKAKKERKENQPVAGGRILQLAPYNVNLEYRAAIGRPPCIETEAEMFYVIDAAPL